MSKYTRPGQKIKLKSVLAAYVGHTNYADRVSLIQRRRNTRKYKWLYERRRT